MCTIEQGGSLFNRIKPLSFDTETQIPFDVCIENKSWKILFVLFRQDKYSLQVQGRKLLRREVKIHFRFESIFEGIINNDYHFVNGPLLSRRSQQIIYKKLNLNSMDVNFVSNWICFLLSILLDESYSKYWINVLIKFGKTEKELKSHQSWNNFNEFDDIFSWENSTKI